MPRTFRLWDRSLGKTFDAFLSVRTYATGGWCVDIWDNADAAAVIGGNPWWTHPDAIYKTLSVNMIDLPPPGERQFYVKTWSGHEGLLEQLTSQGVVRVLDPAGVVINQWGSKVFLVELVWPDADVHVFPY